MEQYRGFQSFFTLIVLLCGVVGSHALMHRKVITIGDEFPSMSVGFLNNETEYEIRLNKTAHHCSTAYVCEVFVTLTEMFCRNLSEMTGTAGNGISKSTAAAAIDREQQPYLEISAMISGNRNLTVKWCRDYGITEDFAQDEFLKIRTAVLTPRGDWSSTNATVLLMASFYEQVPLEMETLAVSDESLDLVLDTENKQYELHLNTSSKACLAHKAGECSIGAHIEMACPENPKNSVELQVDVISINNETISKILWPLKCNDPASATAPGLSRNISTYLVNVQTLILSPTGSWKAAQARAKISLTTVISVPKTQHCPNNFLDCAQDCNFSDGVVAGSNPLTQVPNLFQVPISFTDFRCIPWSWVCRSAGGGPCENQCMKAEKFCNIRKYRDGSTTSAPAIKPTAKISEPVVKGSKMTASCIFHYAFFLVPLSLILITFFGTAYILRRRIARVDKTSRTTNDTGVHGSRTGLLFGNLQKNIPYHLMENETT